MSLFRGISYVVLQDRAYTKYPEAFAFFGQEYLGNDILPFSFFLFLVLAVIFGIVLHKTSLGRKIYAIGKNDVASQFSGIPVRRYKLALFALNGLCSGIAAILLTSRIGSTRPNIANGWELEIITSVVLGGIAISGGRGNIFGLVISIFLLGFLRYGMGLLNVPGKVMNIVIGSLLIVAIILTELLKNVSARKQLARQKTGDSKF